MTLVYGNDPTYDDKQIRRHWHPQSETYAGGDCLLTAMNEGWQAAERVYCEEHWHAGSRLVTIYHFDLERRGERMTMPVISNPYVRRILSRLQPTISSIDERAVIERRASNGSRG